jgi:uncharacterized protein YndB with AHSA1/START domain
MKASPEDIFACLVTPERLTAWWASSAESDPVIDGFIRVGFAGLTTLEFIIRSIDPPRLLSLRCHGEPENWKGCELTFDIEPADQQTYVRLTQTKEPASDEEFLFFNTKWPLYLVSLKDLLETGKGRPFPDDIRIDHP